MVTLSYSRSVRFVASIAGFALLTTLSAAARGEPPGPASDRPTDQAAAWQVRYQRARHALIDGRYAYAASEFDALEATAPSPEDRRAARELGDLGRAKIAAELSADTPHIRTRDELSVLYAAAFLYGVGTSGWVALQVEPRTVAGAMLPFAAITTAAVGSVAVIDGYYPFRRGVPHSIATGLYLGFGEGVLIVGYQHARASRLDDGSRWRAAEVSTALWAGATSGALLGATLGVVREPTPGRAALTGSAAIWSGLIAGFAGAALQGRDAFRGETSFLVGGIAYNLGIGAGLGLARELSPSIQRVRFVDLGGLGGGLLGAGGYALVAPRGGDVRGLLGSAAIGAGAGLALTWWLTSDMPKDFGPAAQSRTPTAVSLQPVIVPTQGGAMFSAIGEL